jgi:hypothetical protein
VDGYVFEVTVDGTIVWDYDGPDRIARAPRYWDDATAVPPAGDTVARPVLQLGPIRPNPFNPTTVISYEVSRAANVTLAIFDVRGNRVRTLLNGKPHASGFYREEWDGRNDSGQVVDSGVYFTRIGTRGFVATRKSTLLK